MDIKFTGKFKSLKSFEWKNIPKLAIITGLNGAGKSQLLELINKFLMQSFPHPHGGIQASQIDAEINGALFDASEVIFLKGEWELNESLDVDLAKIQGSYTQILTKLVQNSIQEYYHSDFKLYKKLFDIRSYFNAQGITPQNISPDAFRDQFEKSTVADDKGIVQKVSEFFYNYQLNYLDQKLKGKNDNEITSAIGPKPWDILRLIIKEANLPFEITDPASMGIRDSFKFTITKTTSREIVKFDDLSSGERVLFSLAFLMFNSQETKRYPKLLLLDEPDAHLHPSMTAQLLKVIKNVLVDQYGVQVIMTTHSPSTIAISPEDSIFLLDPLIGFPEPSPKDIAIKSLLTGIPNLFVTYENRRQVFVESSYDVNYYDKIYKRIFLYLNKDVNLNFISSGEAVTDKNGRPTSNCDQVIKITKTLNDAGNNQIYGIIDFDEGKNAQTSNLIILGEGNRYSIENYIFDPILIGMLLLREKMITSVKIGTADLVYNDSSSHTQDNLQQLSDYVVESIFTEEELNGNTNVECEMLSGLKVNISNSYLMNQGHDLEDRLLKSFPKLNDLKKSKEDKLKLAVIDKVIDDFPTLISIDVVNSLKQIQS